MTLITDLRCDGDTKESLWKIDNMNHIGPTYFGDKDRSKRHFMKIVFDTVPTNNDEVKVKVALLYLLSNVMLTNSPSMQLPKFYIDLVDDLELFNKNPWGKLLWDETRDQMEVGQGRETL
ncbi:hypothetical protein PanWU01x14_047430 [Parasponia andersonii]|uniref:DUF1985 domain-containing protein n=1 Tax=Parasponia andersonii TaxID=3476 RepID=A0A2P5DN31_PARAD|nr:hypothetical protein PanWU01x14_047430 [Parasponia andersonii]